MKLPILLVEDDENDIFFLTKALKKIGVENPLQVACGGQEALDYMEGRGVYARRDEFPLPGLILLDLKLPQVKGLEVLKRVRDQFGPRPVVIVLSSSKMESDIVDAYRLGANAYLTKPAGFSALVEAARAIADFWLKYNVSDQADMSDDGSRSAQPEAV